MNLKRATYLEFAKNIRERNSRIYVYGAGMIGQIVVPYIIDTYQLHDYVECYVDIDERKTGKNVVIGAYEYEIRLPGTLKSISKDAVILLTNSRFYSVLNLLDSMETLSDVDCYIVPMMQMLEQRPKIPKKIHYCWFGGNELSDFLKECMESWYRYCPDYEILRWDETNFDINKYEYTRQAAAHKKWGFVTDVARLDILYRYGGIYLDTDVKLLKPLDDFLYQKGFVGVEQWGNINSGGGIGAVPHHPMIQEMLDYRLQFPFVMSDGSLNAETNGLYETIPFIKHGMRIDNSLQVVNDMVVYPASVFHPYNYISCEEEIKNSTISIHYFSGGWMEKDDKTDRRSTQEQYEAVKNRMHS